MADAKLHDESARLAALDRYELLDTPREPQFDRITGLVQAVFGAPIASISLIDADRQWFKSSVGLDVESTPREESFCKHTIKNRQPMNVSDAVLDPRFKDNASVLGPPFVRSYLGVPLATPDGYHLGSLCVVDTKPREYTDGQVEVLSRFAALVMDEIELRRLAHEDPLTGAMSRRAFLLEVEKACERHRRHGRLSAFLLMDIDHFKHINDTFGHPTGDLVLQTIGKNLPPLLRMNDGFGRLGGEEFGLIVTENDAQSAFRTAERIRAWIEALKFQHEAPIRVTTSIGIAMVSDSCSPAEQWLAKADNALYAAKRSGRNKCCMA